MPLSYTYALEGSSDGERLLSPQDWLVPGENDMEIEIVHLSSDDWVYFNLDQAGEWTSWRSCPLPYCISIFGFTHFFVLVPAPYRVNYDTFNWRMLTRELLQVQFDKTLPAASRAHILGDALALARAGTTKLLEAFTFPV